MKRTNDNSFQLTARNYGLDEKYLKKLQGRWPSSREEVADALYAAGVPPGRELLEMAADLWTHRPDWLSR